MSGYTKLFASIVSSTVWREDDKTRLVWITMLAMRDRFHVVESSIPGLADFAKVSLEDCEKALKKLSSPDPYSRTEDFEGRRIEKVDGGWLILNGEKYLNKMNEDERREANRIYQQRHRQRKKDVSKVSYGSDISALSAQEEEHKEEEKDKDKMIMHSHSFYSKPKERAPTYPQLPPKREPTEQELETARNIAHQETERLRQQLYNHSPTTQPDDAQPRQAD